MCEYYELSCNSKSVSHSVCVWGSGGGQAISCPSRARNYQVVTEMMCNGEFLQKDPDEAIEYLNDLDEKAHPWTGPNAIDSTDRTRSTPSSGGIHHFREDDSLKAQVELLTREIGALKAKDSKSMHAVAQFEPQEVCFVCKGIDHLAQECPVYGEMRGMYEEQCNTLGMYKKPYTPYSETYNPSWRNHPNFSWKNESQQSTQPPQPRAYTTPQYHTPTTHRNSLEDTVQAFIEAQSKTNHRFESLIAQVVEENKEMKSQFSKLTNVLSVQEPGKLHLRLNQIREDNTWHKTALNHQM